MNLEELIADRRIDGALLETLREIAKTDGALLDELADALRPSANTLREILRLAREVALRDGCGLSAVLLPERLREIGGNESMSVKERQRLLRRELELRRYPEKSRMQKAAEDAAREIRTRFGFSVTLPQELEGDSLGLEVVIRNPEEARKAAEQLAALAGSAELCGLFDLLLGRLIPTTNG